MLYFPSSQLNVSRLALLCVGEQTQVLFTQTHRSKENLGIFLFINKFFAIDCKAQFFHIYLATKWIQVLIHSSREIFIKSMLNWEGIRSYQLPHLTPPDFTLHHITLLICFTPGSVKGNPEGKSEKMLKITSLGKLLKPWIGMGTLDPGEWLGGT